MLDTIAKILALDLMLSGSRAGVLIIILDGPEDRYFGDEAKEARKNEIVDGKLAGIIVDYSVGISEVGVEDRLENTIEGVLDEC